MSTPLLQASQLRLCMGGRTLIDGLDWQVEAGQCWTVIGCNGVGKSTLLRTLAGLHAPDGGQVMIAGQPLSAWHPAELARQRAFLAQSRSDAFGYTALETVLAARHPYHGGRYWENGEDHHAALRALEAMEVLPLAGRDVRTLSGGERQRVAIAALLAQDCPLLLLDEPANALDLPHQVSVMALLAKLCREQGKAVILVGHDLNLAYGVATHALLLMGDGWQAGPAEAMLQAPLLSQCLGHPIEAVRHGKRTIFIPAAVSESGREAFRHASP